MSTERFGTRYALVAAGISMAVGAGNIWRFPRIVAEWGSGTFLIILVLANLVWAIPVLMAESLLGSKSRLGTVGAFRDFMGRGFAWMGAVVALIGVGILFYYSVVSGWALRYFAYSLTGTFSDPDVDTEALWNGFTASPPQTILFHLIAILIVGAVVYRGLKRGFEGVLNVALPALFVIMIILAIRALTLPGGVDGLKHMFTLKWGDLGNPRVWLEAFTQMAFSTGAGWALYLTYAVYSRQREDMGGNAVLLCVGNLFASLLAGITVLGALFALSSPETRKAALGPESSNEGLAFIHIPGLFTEMPGGVVFGPLFFLALALAGLSSLIAMVELATRNIVDMGVSRQKAVMGVVAVAFVLGLPSAFSLDVFTNQDFVWGTGLLVSGLLIAIAMMKYGLRKARAEFTSVSGAFYGTWWVFCICLIPPLVIVLLGWWMYQSVVDFAPDTWWNPVDPLSLATLVVQLAIAVVIGLALNGFLARSVGAGPMSGGADPTQEAATPDS